MYLLFYFFYLVKNTKSIVYMSQKTDIYQSIHPYTIQLLNTFNTQAHARLAGGSGEPSFAINKVYKNFLRNLCIMTIDKHFL